MKHAIFFAIAATMIFSASHARADQVNMGEKSQAISGLNEPMKYERPSDEDFNNGQMSEERYEELRARYSQEPCAVWYRAHLTEHTDLKIGEVCDIRNPYDHDPVGPQGPMPHYVK